MGCSIIRIGKENPLGQLEERKRKKESCLLLMYN